MRCGEAAIAAPSNRIRRKGVKAAKDGGVQNPCAAKSLEVRCYRPGGCRVDSPATTSRAISTLQAIRSPSDNRSDRRRSESSAKQRRSEIKLSAHKIPRPPIAGPYSKCEETLAWIGAVGGAPHLSAPPAFSCLPDCALGWQDAFTVEHSLSPRRAARQQVIARKIHFGDFRAEVDRKSGR